ncbi:MAG: hypothetical protein KIS76_12555, partial [Pyrinomonadaceae bacterium]|nr:hypothetical protein [Pyrinomonadaceae bacterium]
MKNYDEYNRNSVKSLAFPETAADGEHCKRPRCTLLLTEHARENQWKITTKWFNVRVQSIPDKTK